MCPGKMKWHAHAAVVKEVLTTIVPVQAGESCPCCFQGKIARAMCTAMFPYLMILWEASITLRRGLIKIECHLVLKTIVRMTVWLVSSFTNKPGNTIYMYVWKGGICKDCYFSALPQTWHTQPFKSVPNLKLEMKATYLRGDLKYL